MGITSRLQDGTDRLSLGGEDASSNGHGVNVYLKKFFLLAPALHQWKFDLFPTTVFRIFSQAFPNICPAVGGSHTCERSGSTRASGASIFDLGL